MISLAVVLLSLPQDAAATPPTPYDRVFELELGADDPELIDGRGPTVVVEYEVEFSGTLHVWTRSELDLFVQVDDALEARTLATDDDSGGGTTPYLALQVSDGDRLAVLVAGAPGASGALTLHLVACPETEATLELAAAVPERVARIRGLRDSGDLESARGAMQALAETIRTTPGAEESQRATSLLSGLGLLAGELGDLQAQRALRDRLRAVFERTLPPEHPDLLHQRLNLAATMQEQGDHPGARALYESVLATRERTLSADHPDLLRVRHNTAITMAEMGDLPGARALFEAVLAGFERTLPADHRELLAARLNLASTMKVMGDLPGARALFEAVLAGHERTLPADHPELLAARLNLADTMRQQGDLPRARALHEAVLAARERTLPEDHPVLLRARAHLATTMQQMGDLPGARSLYESVLAASERTLPADHPSLLRVRNNLADTMRQQGDLPRARALHEAVLAGFERTLPADHPELLVARANLAVTMGSMGDLAGARALQEAVLAACERMLPADHPQLLRARGNLAVWMREQGDLPGARVLEEAVLAGYERTFPVAHPDLLHARGNLLVTLLTMGDLGGARALVGAQVGGMRALVLGSLTLAPRQAREAVRAEMGRLAGALVAARGADPELQGRVFELQETMRSVAGESARALRATEDPEVRRALQEASRVRAALGDLAARSSEHDRAAFSAELTHLLQQRDRLEQEASRRMAAQGVATRAVELGPLRRSLGADAALVSFLRVSYGEQAEDGRSIRTWSDHLLAHVLSSDGSLVRIDLGEAAELEELARAWRAAIGAPLLRGVAAPEGAHDAEAATGEALRARLLDQVFEVLGETVARLHVCADDLVYLVPLDALPMESGRVGDRWSVVNEVSCARLLAPNREEERGKGLLALGGVDYDAGAVAETEASSATRSAMKDEFARLLQTRFEVETTGALAAALLGIEPVVLTKQDATKAALFELARGKRYLHLATHGWFADEGLKSMLDDAPARANGRGWTSMGVEVRVTGMAPMLLCGLALAGANRPMDSLGRRTGILTAEELCSLDLSQCDLAVLSACETNVGIRRAGQGIQSLQAALYAAGARSSITSLWKVDDAATRRLFELFYTKLWEEKLPKAQALWEAKKVLRDEGAPVRDWAAWVLTGDPD